MHIEIRQISAIILLEGRESTRNWLKEHNKSLFVQILRPLRSRAGNAKG